MEVKANEAFDLYREMYYEGGVSSVYFWNLDDGFAGVVLLKKGEFLNYIYFLRFLSVVLSVLVDRWGCDGMVYEDEELILLINHEP